MNPLRIAMWSGPRNISTAMMRSWENRDDCAVIDEPFYAHYLQRTGADHPGREEVIENDEPNEARVLQRILGPPPGDCAIYYQKHMAHHLLAGMDRSWMDAFAHAFLIRCPRDMMTSLQVRLGEFTAEETGLPQQLEIFESIRKREGRIPPVIDSRDVLTDPRRVIGLLTEALGVGFQQSMLSWEAGKRESDGVWAHHWYDRVWESTGFAPYRPKTVEVPEELEEVLHTIQPIYDRLYEERLH